MKQWSSKTYYNTLHIHQTDLVFDSTTGTHSCWFSIKFFCVFGKSLNGKKVVHPTAKNEARSKQQSIGGHHQPSITIITYIGYSSILFELEGIFAFDTRYMMRTKDILKERRKKIAKSEHNTHIMVSLYTIFQYSCESLPKEWNERAKKC